MTIRTIPGQITEFMGKFMGKEISGSRTVAKVLYMDLHDTMQVRIEHCMERCEELFERAGISMPAIDDDDFVAQSESLFGNNDNSYQLEIHRNAYFEAESLLAFLKDDLLPTLKALENGEPVTALHVEILRKASQVSGKQKDGETLLFKILSSCDDLWLVNMHDPTQANEYSLTKEDRSMIQDFMQDLYEQAKIVSQISPRRPDTGGAYLS